MKRRNTLLLLASSMLLMAGCASTGADASTELIAFAAYQSADQNYAAVKLDRAQHDHRFLVDGDPVEAIPVSADQTIVRLPIEATGAVTVRVETDGDDAVEQTLTFSAPTGVAPAADGYLYGTTPMRFADFWYGELEDVPAPGALFALDAPDETAYSAGYLAYFDGSTKGDDRYLGMQKNTYDNDSGMYDAITRATVGYGIYRSSFAHTVELTRDDGTTARYQNEIVADAAAPTGYRIDQNTTGVEGIVLSDNTRLDTEHTTNYTPDTMVSFEESTRAGGGGYTIEGLRSVVVKVDADTLANAAALDALAIRDPQADAFLAQAAQITFDETIDPDTVYAVKELLANGIYGARTVDPNGQARDPGRVWVGDGTNDSKRIANNDGYADLTVYIYFDQDYIWKRPYTVYGRFSLNKTQYLVVSCYFVLLHFVACRLFVA